MAGLCSFSSVDFAFRGGQLVLDRTTIPPPETASFTISDGINQGPSTAVLVQVAGRIHENWLAEDKVAAQRQRAAAEATLKRLETAAA